MAVIGIDLGTTISVVAHLNEHGKPEVLSNAEGDQLTPSVVYFEGPTNKVVGSVAKQNAIAHEGQVVECVKNAMGKDLKWTFFGEEHTPEYISAIILRKLKEDAELALDEPVEGAVITVPAIFGDAERSATRNAGTIAGLNILGILDEPVAAAIAYGFGRRGAPGEERTIMVYDLGGGTFDVTVMRLKDGEFSMLWTDGDRSLGGRKWDERIMKHVSEEFERANDLYPMDDPGTRQDLWNKAEVSKKQISKVDSSPIVCQMGGQSAKVELTREKFDEITSDLLELTKNTTEEVIRKLGENNTLPNGWEDIDEILLVGGSTRMPQVAEMLRALTGKEPKVFEQDKAVAQGAAIYAVERILNSEQGSVSDASIANIPDIVKETIARTEIQRVCSFAIGVIALNQQRQEENDLLVPRNSKLPFSTTKRYSTSCDNQIELLLEIMEGDSKDRNLCIKLGEGRITGIPPNLPEGSPVDVSIGLDDESLMVVKARELTYGKSVEFVVKRATGLTDEEVQDHRSRLTMEAIS
ncbi:MAG: Hsp70 family protein [Fimbriimonadaceae bacterium]|nr:Hsp70 family protein [Fimbriimonadaceae bacterium]QOJ10773.1 MAG: Hsp70 family protein [Chthonomonadaceae bacterium]